MKIYVEGGGDTNMLKTACRQGFSEFVKKVGLEGRMPRIVACGSRQDAYDAYSTAIAHGQSAMLWVDSEAPVGIDCERGEAGSWLPWKHLGNREGDRWAKPANSAEINCHLIVQCMEAWLLADRDVPKNFFGQGFRSNALPSQEKSIESIPKYVIYRSLSGATHNCKTKASYSKGEHSFKLLAMVAPEKVASSSPWARRFVEAMKGSRSG